MGKTVTNTAANPRPDWLSGRNSQAIEAQEAAGQQELVQSETLPAKMSYAEIEKLQKLGVVFGENVPGDRLFRFVTLPKGWKKVGTDHSMWSKLVDDKGNEVASIFYKAAFYDRDAFLRLS